MKVTDWVKQTLAILRRQRQCIRECGTALSGPRYVENPSFIFCDKHRVWRELPDHGENFLALKNIGEGQTLSFLLSRDKELQGQSGTMFATGPVTF
jgi:hypothetical protein